MYDQQAKMAESESNMATAAQNASRAIESLQDSITRLRDRLGPVLVPAPPTDSVCGAGVSAVEPPAASITYEFRGLTSRADSLRAQVDDMLRRLDV